MQIYKKRDALQLVNVKISKREKMAEKLDKKVRDYIRKVQKQGYSKEQIKNSLLKAGYDMSIVDKNITSVGREKQLKYTLLVSLIAVIILGYFAVSNYSSKNGSGFSFSSSEEDNLVFYDEQPKEKFSQSTKQILLMEWRLPPEAKQNELVNLTTIWKSQEEVRKDYGMILVFVDDKGRNIISYFFMKNNYPTNLRRTNYTYLENHFFKIPYLKPDIYYFKIGMFDMQEKRWIYSYGGSLLGNITIKKNVEVTPCGLVIVAVKDNSLASSLGISTGEVILSVNGKPVKFGNDLQEARDNINKIISNADQVTLKTDKNDYTINKEAITKNDGELGIVFNVELCQK